VTSKVFFSKARKEILTDLSEDQRMAAGEIIAKNFKPNINYSAKLTDEARIFEVKSVARTNGFVRAGEVIISKGEIVDEETTQKIQSYNLFKFKGGQNTYNFWLILGNIFHAAVIYSILILYLFIIRKRIFEDNVQIIILSASVVIVSLLAWLSIEVKSTLPIEYFIILPGVSMLVAIAFDSRTAFYLTVTMSLMLAGIRGNDYDTGTAMMFSGILASYSVRDIQSRTQMFKSISYIFIGFLASIIAFSLERSLDWDLTIQKLLVALLNSAISPLTTFGLLFLLERFTNITTDLKLEEYDKVNHPLLVKLSEIAPGSYQHSLSMSVMAEKCATAINASQILAKVGALYHDIGKITKPEYFVENQIEIGNKHDMLTPKRSADAIKSHIVEGVKLAKEYKLPQRIIDFIPMHHGTFLIKHFYAKAIEELGESAVHEEDYRYPGPKPNSKETAIVMICDSAEAISRVSGKSREDIEKMLNTTIQSRFTDGQFDECDLTLNDLHIIKEACVKHLYGSSHQRIDYKEIKESAPVVSNE
jgi:putative nucleotidyltransferase with HDIG domain